MLLTNNDFFINKKMVSSKIQQAKNGGGLEVSYGPLGHDINYHSLQTLKKIYPKFVWWEPTQKKNGG